MNINIIYTNTYTNANFDYRINMVQKWLHLNNFRNRNKLVSDIHVKVDTGYNIYHILNHYIKRKWEILGKK